MKRSFLLIVLSVMLVLSGSGFATAKINFQKSVAEEIELESLQLSKEDFLRFVEETILAKPLGLGKYGRVSFYPCDLEVEGKRLIEYKTLEGKEVRFLSNPSCHQVVLRRVLEKSYQYQKANLSGYENRSCILAVERMISPILEYYTIKYEERQDSGCSSCDFKEKERMDKILAEQSKIIKSCKSETKKVMNFITDLDSRVEKTYLDKNNKP